MRLDQAKPIHLRCPKCGHDFSYNSNHIEEEIDQLKCDISSIKNQMTQFKAKNPYSYKNDQWYRRAHAAMDLKSEQMVKLKKARKATVVEIEAQKNNIFRQLVADKYGKDEMMRLMKEAEDQMCYYDYDMASQTFTRFEGV